MKIECAYVKLESTACAFVTNIFTFALFVSKQLIVLLLQHTTMIENKKRNIKREGIVFNQNGQTNICLQL